MDGVLERHVSSERRRLRAAPAALCFVLGSALAGCGDMNRFQTAAAPPTVAMPKPKPAVAQTPATEKEHERILASYGGTYDDPRLESLVSKTVDRLVAASDRPDQGYKVTILNSGAVNAFALPNGQLYVTRGLLALASDTSELSSVLSHEMAHVLSKHAAMREDQARQAAIVTRVVTDMSNDPDLTALALAKTKLTMASFSRNQEFEADGIGVGLSAKAHFDPYGAARFLSAMESAMPSSRSARPRSIHARRISPRRIRRPPSACRMHRPSHGNMRRPRAPSATARPTSPRSTTSSMARIPAKVLSAAGASCTRNSASPSRHRTISRSTTPRRR
ncbi:putative Zn-dependent protease [Bradyrhizobium japonicum]|nr:putative Zn-dependent protease [Bradyrhizobium japonicum]